MRDPQRHTQVIVVPDEFLAQVLADAETALRARGVIVRVMAPDEFVRGSTASHETAEVALVGVAFRFTRERMQTMPRLRGIVSGVIGTDTIDLDAASDLGIWVGYGPNPHTVDSAAEATILLMLALLYDLRRHEGIVRECHPRPRQPIARMLKRRIIGLVGYGRIAQAVAARLQNWDVEILAYRRSPRPVAGPPQVRFVPLEALLARSDIVSIHASLNPESRDLLDRRNLERMKPGACLVNTARGAIVDEAALHELVRDGHIRTVALDAFRVEPLPADSPLRRLPDAILTPHMLCHTQESYASLAQTAAENVLAVLAGKPPQHCLNANITPGIRGQGRN